MQHTWISEFVGNVVGYFFAIVVGHIAVAKVYKKLWSNTDWFKFKENQRFVYAPALVGIVERTLYVASIQFGSPEFIAVWLAMKVAGQWKTWEEGGHIKDENIRGRVFFNFFLIGTGFSLAYALVGYTLISNISCGKYLTAAVSFLSLIIGSFGFVKLINHYQNKHDPNDDTENK